MNAVVIEDDAAQADLVVATLCGMEYECDVVVDGCEGLRRLMSGRYDFAVVDLTLPGMDGLEVIRRARSSGCDIPVLVLTARTSEDDVVRGLSAAADAYLTKPCSMRVLREHVKALMRRLERRLSEDRIRVNGIVLDRRTRCATRNGRDLALTPCEFNLLELLLSNRGSVVTYERIVDEVWSGRPSVSHHNIAQSVDGLRFKISGGESSVVIENKRGFGYVVW